MRKPRAGRTPARAVLSAVVLTLALALASASVPGAARAQAGVDSLPPDNRPNAMRAPAPRSGPRLPLGTVPAAGFGHLLKRPVESTPQPLFLGMLRFWRRVVSPVDGSDADLAPVPSLYAVQAIQTHGVLLGTVLTTGRLIDEPSVIPDSPRFREHGREFHYDPLHWNDYWLPDWLRGD